MSLGSIGPMVNPLWNSAFSRWYTRHLPTLVFSGAGSCAAFEVVTKSLGASSLAKRASTDRLVFSPEFCLFVCVATEHALDAIKHMLNTMHDIESGRSGSTIACYHTTVRYARFRKTILEAAEVVPVLRSRSIPKSAPILWLRFHTKC